ncbi:MAG: hypothetical protein LBG27_03635 [Spirochaetaceae bacterium]|nr:hypothetical protein [Spirochaetaceae bacterium]
MLNKTYMGYATRMEMKGEGEGAAERRRLEQENERLKRELEKLKVEKLTVEEFNRRQQTV